MGITTNGSSIKYSGKDTPIVSVDSNTNAVTVNADTINGGGVTVNSVNGVNFGSGTLTTTAQSVIGSINEIHENLKTIAQDTIENFSEIHEEINQINRDLMKAMLVADMSISGTTRGYIQFESGLMIQWAEFSGWNNSNGNRLKLPMPFIDKNYFVARGDAGTGTSSGHDYNTTFIVDVQTLGGASWQGGGWFIVIGRWK